MTKPLSHKLLLAIDPGREKCGVALADEHGESRWQAIVARSEVTARVQALLSEYSIEVVVLGHATSSGTLADELKSVLAAFGVSLVTVDETGSTLEARTLYWQKNPPRGLKKLIPLSAQVPPVPLDDYAALVLARRYLQSR